MTLSVRLVQFNSTLSWTRQRYQGRRKSSPFAPPDSSAPSESWSIFPYSVGLLESYVRTHHPDPDSVAFLGTELRPEPPAEVAERLAGADVVGFSTYVWNEVRSLRTAEILKRASPDTLVVFGGPQVPDDPTAWMARHPFVDIVVHGEGEAAFNDVLQAAHGRDWSDVPSVSWRNGPDGITTNPRRARLHDLEAIPSPYLSGIFDPLLQARPDEKWIMLWETNRGCPFSCTFCDWGSATASKVFRFGMERLERELDWFGRLGGEFIFCCDANFGILPRDVDLARMAAATKGRYGYPRTLSVQNTKNRTDRAYEVHRTLADAQMHGGVTLALQSLDEAALKAVKRDNISLDAFLELQRRFRADGIPTYTDVILALPDETYATFADGVGGLIAGGQHTRVQFYNCAILPNAAMADPAYVEEYGLVTVPQRLLANHVPVDDEDDGERVEVVVRTRAMPGSDWRRAKTFSWYADLLHFDRLLHLPFVIAHGTTGATYRELVESVMDADAASYPELGGLRERLGAHALAIQEGGQEPVAEPEWLGLWWPADQWALIDLVRNFRMDGFYAEAEAAVGDMLARNGYRPDPTLLSEAFRLNRHLFAQPFEIDDLELDLERDAWACYEAILAGTPPAMGESVRGTVVRTRPIWLTWDGWMEHVTFCHNQKTAYLWPWQVGVPVAT